jgi:Ni2+-binding GTPase involved in maturation of urease and hydrogenase
MKIITVAGPPYAGKTMVIAHLVNRYASLGVNAAAAKFNAMPANGCAFHKSELQEPFLNPSCHFALPGFIRASNLKEVFEWGRGEQVDVLFVETPVVCCKWAPLSDGIPVVTVADCFGCVDFTDKMERIVKLADAVAITKTDLASGGEAKALQRKIRLFNTEAPIVPFNGLSGNGAFALLRIVDRYADANRA